MPAHPVMLHDLSSLAYKRVRATNYSTNGYPSRVPTVTAPSGDGVVLLNDPKTPGQVTPRSMILIPYGTDASTHTFTIKMLGWRPTLLNLGPQLWMPVQIAEFTATLGTAAGVANADLGTTQQFATTIVLTTNGPTWQNAAAPNTIPPVVPDLFIVSPGSNNIGAIFLRNLGFPIVEIIFSTGGVVTDCNSLYSMF